MQINKPRNILMYFSALLLSAFGYEFIFFIMTLHVYDLSRNALNIGIFTTLTFIPRLFSSLMGGIADKTGKIKCFVLSAIMVSILMFLMSLAADIRQIYMIWFLTAIFLTFIVNVRSSMMAEIMNREHYTTGNALVLSLLNGAKLLGPLLGGFIASLYRIELLLYFTCIVYLLVAASSACIRIAESENQVRSNFFDNAKKGFTFMLENHIFSLLASIAFFWRLFLGLQLSLFVVYIKSFLSGTSEQYGVFITVMGLGSIVGSLLGPYAARRIHTRRLIAVGLGLHYLSFAALGLCRSYYLSLIIIFTGYMVFYMTLVGMHAERDRITRFDIRSSTYGTVTAILTPPAIISMLAGGYLANIYGSPSVLSASGLLALLSLYIILFLGRNANKALGSEQKQKTVEEA